MEEGGLVVGPCLQVAGAIINNLEVQTPLDDPLFDPTTGYTHTWPRWIYILFNAKKSLL